MYVLEDYLMTTLSVLVYSKCGFVLSKRQFNSNSGQQVVKIICEDIIL